MRAVIFCGGLGTRLREETEFRPSRRSSWASGRFSGTSMKIISAAGINDFILCLGYRGNMIKEYFLNYEPMNIASTNT
jgi:glucose-1-phosphate cytidylyltransferase